MCRHGGNKIFIQVSGLLPVRKLTGLIIDETGVLKKRDKSIGVCWQYCGNVGKTTNCQVAAVAYFRNIMLEAREI